METIHAGPDCEQRGPVVFELRDAIFPPPNELLRLVTTNLAVLGEIIGYSDQGESPRSLALVQADSLPVVIVPVNKMRAANLCEL